ncbi:polysaccharide pyruvyl transferase family protein [Oscillatoria sp. CS-180]|nr:polysaccharide pyruvyl transferase family protein [Oscillatoria sp. CS-180]
MKLFHYLRKDGIENFGDRLNLWLWPKLMPNLFNRHDQITFVGIGTLLNHRLPQRLDTEKVVIMGTGVGYGQPLEFLPEGWTVYCVRGPLSARHLGLPIEKAIADGAVLLAQCVQRQQTKKFPVSVMPHIHHAVAAGDIWKTICQALNWGYVDPRWPVETVLSAIDGTELLLAEAMHGAIAADALRVPWMPIQTSPRILNFKWQDWCASIGVAYKPQYLPPLSRQYPPYTKGKHPRITMANYWRRCWQQNHFSGYLKNVESCLLKISRTQPHFLSSSAKLNTLIEQLEGQLTQLESDAAGDYFK